jgi:hypothetical protein
MQGLPRHEMLSHYINAIENGRIEFPMIKWMFDNHRLASVEDVFKSGDNNHLPDDMASGALAWLASGQGAAGEIYIPMLDGAGNLVLQGQKDRATRNSGSTRSKPRACTFITSTKSMIGVSFRCSKRTSMTAMQHLPSSRSPTMPSHRTRLALASLFLKRAEEILIDPTHGIPSLADFSNSERVAALRGDIDGPPRTVATIRYQDSEMVLIPT